jgi:glycosyltransferase involved in cell wall biosynthesis
MEEQTLIKMNNRSKELYNNIITLKIRYKLLNKKYVYNGIILSLILLIILSTFFIKNRNINYKRFINDCKQLKRFNITKIINNKNPYLSICIPVYNMEKYIERALLTIINQSFQDFEIIIVNDNSKDHSQSIMKKIQSEDNRIIINHYKNLGVYASRSDAISNAKGKYIILMDPDDMFVNQELFEQLFNYNSNLNLDIIEFSVIYQEEKKKTIYKPRYHLFNHYHGFDQDIIYQSKLSNIIFYIPNTNNITSIICRTIWNKLVRKNILLKAIDYINIDFKNEFLITADDTPINIIINQFANNYSNINTPGYLYNLRKDSISKGNKGHEHEIIVSINYLLFYKLFYRYIIDFKKNLDFLYKDMKTTYFVLMAIKKYKINDYFRILNSFLYEIAKNEKSSYEFKIFLYKLLNKLSK